MPKTFLGLGSNMGDRELNITRALSFIGKRYEILDYSSLYETEPVGFRDQPHFLNMAVKIDSGDTPPLELLRFVKSAEEELGREETCRWGPRIIDIDILTMEGVELASEELVLPHRELLNRNFVLIPLSELVSRIRMKHGEISIGRRIRLNGGEGQKVSLYKKKEELHIHE